MGNSNSSFKPEINVRERHIHAVYINIPLSKFQLESFTLSPCECDVFDDSSWISIVIDDLDTLEAHFAGRFIDVSNIMRGWMCKLNLLVKCPVPTQNSTNNQLENVSGYQIVALDFEEGTGGSIKRFGALQTQIIPTELSSFHMSSGISGSAINYSLQTGETYSAEIINPNTNAHLVKLVGKLNSNLSPEQLNFTKFVINRPHKLLYQNFGTDQGKLAYSPEIGDGANFEWNNCVWIDPEHLELPILNRLSERFNETLDISKIRCFIQPSYTLVDHHNTILATVR